LVELVKKKQKDFLLTWWSIFDDVRWKNFGKEEGLFAARLIERWFGTRMWSPRRLVVAVGLLGVFSVIAYLRLIISNDQYMRWCELCNTKALGWVFPSAFLPASIPVFLAASLIGFSMSVSLTKFMTIQMANLCGDGQVRNVVVFICMILINYFLLILWWPIGSELKIVISLDPHLILDGLKTGLLTINRVTLHPLDIFYPYHFIDTFSLFYLSLFSYVFRAVLSIIFVGSFLLRPIVMRPINFVWRRILESDKPIFTIIFGGAAAFASAIREATKHR
jgi:hypothetical protein